MCREIVSVYRETKSVCVYRDLEIEGVCVCRERERERERRKCSGLAGVSATPRDFCLIPQNFFDDPFWILSIFRSSAALL